jgi:EAL domain-containing protein (putative c-di-GMP-specific phosphodiesterase class I)
VLGEVATGAQVLERLRQLPSDLLLLDLNMPGDSGADLITQVKAHQFAQVDIVEQVLAVSHSTGANPQRRKLELTKSLLISNLQDTIGKMHAMKAKGVCFALDDIGTGYSSSL